MHLLRPLANSLIFLFLTLNLAFTNELSSLQDRLATYQFLFSSEKIINESKSLLSKRVFKEKIGLLSQEKQNEINQFITSSQYYLPEEIIISYLYWREIQKDNQKASRVLHYSFLYRLLTIRDLIDHPQNNNKTEAVELLRNLLNDPEVDSHNIFARANPLVDHLALTIHEKPSLSHVALALENTPIVKSKIALTHYRPYIISPFGYLTDSTIEIISLSNTDTKVLSMIKEAQTDLTLTTALIDHDPKIEEMIIELVKSNKLEVNLIWDKDLKEKKVFWEQLESEYPKSLNLYFSHSYSKNLNLSSLDLLPEVMKVLNQDSSLGTQIIIKDTLGSIPEYFIPDSSPDQSSLLIKGAAAQLSLKSLYPDLQFKSQQAFEIEKSTEVRPGLIIADSGTLRLALQNTTLDKNEIRPTLIDMISHANKSIAIQSHFFFDSTIVDTLLKRKIQVPDLQVKILIDHNLQYGLGGFPNTLFLLELQKYGIEIRAPKEVMPKRAVVIVDGLSSLVIPQDIGALSLPQDSGLHAIQIFSPDEVQASEADFDRQWDTFGDLYELNIKDFKLKNQDSVWGKATSRLLNAIGSLILRSR